KLKEDQERHQRIQQEQVQAKGQPGGEKPAPGAVPKPPGGVTAPSGAVLTAPAVSREAALKEGARIGIGTPSLKGSIALKGGRIDDLVLAKYRETVDPGSPNVVLLSPSGAPQPYYAEYGWVAANGESTSLPGREAVWSAETAGPLTPSSPVTLTWDN